ncbi:MAG: hypothetical protein IKJ25_01355 [Clostridia bacterium]|nr:hypothetical protein [Clostridia bacterium]
MRDIKKIVIGAVILAAGVLFALNALNVTDIDIFFPGWWTLFIIIPSGIGLITDKDKTGSAIGLSVGVVLLLWQLDVVNLSLVWELIVVAILVAVGIKLIVGGTKKSNSNDGVSVNISVDAPSGCAIFGGKEMNFDGQVFEGTELTAVFGGVDCDLSGAIIKKDCKIKATAIFGGVDIILPKGVNVSVSSTSIFGGTDDAYVREPASEVTVYIETVSVFGGVDIK